MKEVEIGVDSELEGGIVLLADGVVPVEDAFEAGVEDTGVVDS